MHGTGAQPFSDFAARASMRSDVRQGPDLATIFVAEMSSSETSLSLSLSPLS